MKLVINVPPDASMLSMTLYEGVAYLLRVAGGESSPQGIIEVPDDALARAFKEIPAREGGRDGVTRKIALQLTGNDVKYSPLNPLFKKLNVKHKDKVRSFGEVIGLIAEAAAKNPNLLTLSGEVRIGIKPVKGKEIFVGSDKPFIKNLAIFKTCDRYAGLRIGEFAPFDKDVRENVSFTATLLCLLGIYSSYVCGGNWGGVRTHIMLFMDPSEIAEVLNTSSLRGLSSSKVIEGMLRAKDVGKELIRELRQAIVSQLSAVLMRLALSLRLAKALEESNIGVLRMRLVRINIENTYKVYNDIPIEARRDLLLSSDLASELAKHVSGGSPLVKCVGRGVAGRAQPCEENNQVLRAIESLYRFVAFRDPPAIAEYARNLFDAINVLNASVVSGNASKNAVLRRMTYRRWLSRLDYIIDNALRWDK